MISAFFLVLFLSNSKDIPDCYETTKVENHYYCKLRFNIWEKFQGMFASAEIIKEVSFEVSNQLLNNKNT